MKNKIENIKNVFLWKYNPNREIKKALELSIKASVQRNPTYSKDIEVNSAIRKQVLLFWKRELVAYADKYKDNISFELYFNDVLALKEKMNLNFKDIFNHPKYENDKGFRIAHSQKSLSVFFKHLWCLGLIKEPPMCPIDNIILTKIGLKYPNNKWGHINVVDEFQNKSNLIIAFAKKHDFSVCKWELLAFSAK
jgi:hypothetical protein